MTDNNQEQKSVRDTIFEKIKSGEIKMQPKIFFIFKAILVILGVVLVIFFILFLVSFIGFKIRATGALFLPIFGFFGMRTFFSSLPWILIIIAAILIFALEVFAKNFTFVYRRPIIYSIIVIIFFVILGGFAIERSPFHPDLFWKAKEGKLPIMGDFYRNPNMAPRSQNVYHGVVSEITENGFNIKESDDKILTVITSSDTKFPTGEKIKEGNIVVVMGEKKDGAITALGVRIINDRFDIFERRPPRFIPFPLRNDK